MSEAVDYRVNQASEAAIAEHLRRCDGDFVPPLSGRVEIDAYARKIAGKATRFEAWAGDVLVGLVAAYCNDHQRGIAYITSVSVLRGWTGRGIAGRLLDDCAKQASATGLRQVSLEVMRDNAAAIGLYSKNGFVAGKADGAFLDMDLYLDDGRKNEQRA
ncbi:MAG: GNAT family N-acetyltransferase [Candidatus Accumulibacter sp.]|uniref:GNAT family N-acetyltransferase n=1 Tax=Accumulibacter sp. TaxID=2053492 RepID=UPI0025EA10C3|nr:GNAT family N-acetyltransferase [Accumulibacter sp.]MCP5249909.1 GNAT family N-acetyltransferase [Accumulibacter sp.]